MIDFNNEMAQHQVAWRQKHIADKRQGTQNGQTRPWILPPELWEEGLWPGIRSGSTCSLPDYLRTPGEEVEKHKGVYNLKSSWIACANLYFPFRQEQGRPLLAGFLRQHVSPLIEAVDAIELEYAEEPPLDPQTLLGEPEGGQRGANQTSPDVAFKVQTATGKGLILTENKLVEHSFYPCSGRKPEVRNPDSGRCLDFQKLIADLPGQCWQLRWESGSRKNRKYWDHTFAGRVTHPAASQPPRSVHKGCFVTRVPVFCGRSLPSDEPCNTAREQRNHRAFCVVAVSSVQVKEKAPSPNRRASAAPLAGLQPARNTAHRILEKRTCALREIALSSMLGK